MWHHYSHTPGKQLPNALLTYNNENLEEFVRDLQLNVQDEVLTVTPDPAFSCRRLNSKANGNKYFKENRNLMCT